MNNHLLQSRLKEERTEHQSIRWVYITQYYHAVRSADLVKTALVSTITTIQLG